MSEVNKMISEMEPLLSLKNEDMMEVVRLRADGSYGNYRTQVSKLRVGQSVYDIAVQNGFVGTEQEYLKTLIGKSAYQITVDSGQFTGTEAEWIQCMEALFSLDKANAGKILVGDAEGVAVFGQLYAKDVGLGKVDDTSDEDKPLSKAAVEEFKKYVPRSRLTTLVMEILLGLPGFTLHEEDNSIRIDASIITGLEGFATTADLQGLAKASDLEGLAKTTEVDDKLEGYATTLALETATKDFVTSETLDADLLKKVDTAEVGVTIATLVDGKVPAEQLPE